MHFFPNIIGKETIDAVLKEANGMPKLAARRVKPWTKTERSTLFVPREPNCPPLVRSVLNCERLAPQTYRFTRMLASMVRTTAFEASLERGYSLDGLEHWRPNRVGFNYRRGSPKEPAHIPLHTDVKEEAGLVVAIDLTNDKAGGVSLIYGHDTCVRVGVEQHPHEVTAHEPRISLTIAQLMRKGTVS